MRNAEWQGGCSAADPTDSSSDLTDLSDLSDFSDRADSPAIKTNAAARI